MRSLTRSLLSEEVDDEDPLPVISSSSSSKQNSTVIINSSASSSGNIIRSNYFVVDEALPSDQQRFITLSDETARWVVLCTYSYLSALQSLLWITYSSVPDFSRSYLGVNDQTLDTFLDLGPAAFVAVVFISSYILTTSRRGLATSIRICALLCFFAALVRCVPVLLSSDSITGDSHGAVVLITYLCQFINGAAAPFVVASPSLLSLVWFPEDQRNSATAIGNVANAAGRAVGFFLGPALVHSSGDLPTLLLLEVGLAMIPLLAAFWIVPDLPFRPPSRAAEEENVRWDRIERAQQRRDRERRIRLFGRSDDNEDDEEDIDEDECSERRRAQIEKECSKLMADLEAAELAEDELEGSAPTPLHISINGDVLTNNSAAITKTTIGTGSRNNNIRSSTIETREGRRQRVRTEIKTLKESLNVKETSLVAQPSGSLLSELRASFTTPSFILICLAGGLQMAIYGMWSGVLPSVLSQISPTAGQPTYSDVQCGWFGFSNTLAGIIGGLLFGGITDFQFFRTRLIIISIALLMSSAVFFGLIAFALPPIQFQSLASIAVSYPTMLSLCIAAGFLRGGSDPLFFELVAESVSSKGVPAGTAGAVLTFFYHVVLVILLAVPPSTLATITLPGMAACLLIAALLMVPARVSYTRRSE